VLGIRDRLSERAQLLEQLGIRLGVDVDLRRGTGGDRRGGAGPEQRTEIASEARVAAGAAALDLLIEVRRERLMAARDQDILDGR